MPLQTKLILIGASFVLIGIAIWIVYNHLQGKSGKKKFSAKELKSNIVGKFEPKRDLKGLEDLFYKAKNPWRMTLGMFRAVRLLIPLVALLIASGFVFVDYSISIFIMTIGILGWWYPKYYYQSIANEREAEWNKFYEYIWVIKNNAMLYPPKKVFLETQNYIEDHAPHNKELIQGFRDFYTYWEEDSIPEYIARTYSFSIPKEIYQIMFNMNQTGQFPSSELDSLRDFIVNKQDSAVESNLSKVAASATLASLPAMMISVIIGLAVPLVVQILSVFSF